MVKSMTYVFAGLLICSLLFLGWKLTSRSAYESAEYTVLETDGMIELREYPDLMMASTVMAGEVESNDGSFGRLFRYICGGNEDEQKVAMTTPVFMESESNDGSDESKNAQGKMSFVIPKSVAEEHVPEPASDQVTLMKRTGGKFAVIRFSGKADFKKREQQKAKLEAWIVKRGHQVEGAPEFASYDPPWTPGPFRRNEILFRLQL